jgi:hypothetical protein
MEKRSKQKKNRKASILLDFSDIKLKEASIRIVRHSLSQRM